MSLFTVNAQVDGVMIKGVLTNPVVYPEVWNTIPDQQVHPSVLTANSRENAEHDEQSDVGDEDKLRIATSKHWAKGVVVSITNLVASNKCAILVSLRGLNTMLLCLLLKPNLAECDLRVALVSNDDL